MDVAAAPMAAEAMSVRSSAKMVRDIYPNYGGYYNYQPSPVV